MLYKLGIKDGFGQLKGFGVHLKIISSVTPVRIEALNNGGRVILQTDLRAPMATMLPEQAATVNLYSATDQTVEVWYSNQPLEYLQLTAVGATRIRSSSAKVYPGQSRIVEANQRQSVTLVADADLTIGGPDVTGDGWPLAANEKENFTAAGEIYAYKPLPDFNYGAISGSFTDYVTTTGYAGLPDYCLTLGDRIVFGNFDGVAQVLVKGETAVSTLVAGVFAVVKDGSYIYFVVFTGTEKKIVRTSDGVSVETVVNIGAAMAAAGAISLIKYTNQTNVKNRDLLVGDWLTTPVTYAVGRGHIAVNIKTGAVIASPANIGTGERLRAIYLPAENVFILSKSGTASDATNGVYKSVAGSWNQIYSNAGVAQRSVMASESGKILLSESGRLARMDISGQVTTLLNINTTRNVVDYLPGSGFLFFDVSFYELHAVDESFTSITVVNTGPSGGLKVMAYDAPEGAIYSMRLAGGGRFDRLAVENLPEYNPVNVKVLEYLI